jgi:hypothetical protein
MSSAWIQERALRTAQTCPSAACVREGVPEASRAMDFDRRGAPAEPGRVRPTPGRDRPPPLASSFEPPPSVWRWDVPPAPGEIIPHDPPIGRRSDQRCPTLSAVDEAGSTDRRPNTMIPRQFQSQQVLRCASSPTCTSFDGHPTGFGRRISGGVAPHIRQADHRRDLESAGHPAIPGAEPKAPASTDRGTTPTAGAGRKPLQRRVALQVGDGA